MTWYILVLISVVCEALESVIDKILVVAKETQIDAMIASFFRNLGFFIFVCIAGVIGIFGPMEFFVSPGIVLLGMIWIINSLIYDTLLKHAELSRFSGILFLFPLLLLILDIFLFGESFSLLQMCALGLLFYGAFQLSLDRSSGTHKSVFSLKIW
ncbi:EamA family transporter [Candidatus Gracilibacteria bacterium]|nr:EamA family transporter [Candidatus Gracilibacteria bacterium]